jgi:class 3 adenylate cyclase
VTGELTGMPEGLSTAYVETGDGGTVAYQVAGDGPIDLLVCGAAKVPLDLFWEVPDLLGVRRPLSRFSRAVWVEPRGWGVADRDLDAERAFDPDVNDQQLTALADAVGSQRFALLACDATGPQVIRYAVTHPDRVSALILFNSFASYVQDDECPWGAPPEFLGQLPQFMAEVWGTGASLDVIAPSRKDDDRLRDWLARGERLAMSPARAGHALRALVMQDARDVLGALRVPTLVMHRRDDAFIRVEAGRYLADHIDGAKYVELPGIDNALWAGDYDAVLDEVEEFLTGSRQAPEGDVVGTTVLFTDIVASTEQSARLGHRKWTALTDAHDAMVRASLDRYRGIEVKTIGDGFLATFDATTRAVRAAIDVTTRANRMGIEIRAGVHSGDVEERADDVIGLTVTIAKRICDLAEPGQVLAPKPSRANSSLPASQRMSEAPSFSRVYPTNGDCSSPPPRRRNSRPDRPYWLLATQWDAHSTTLESVPPGRMTFSLCLTLLPARGTLVVRCGAG